MSTNNALQEAQEVYDKLFGGPEAAIESLPSYREPPYADKVAPKRTSISVPSTKTLPCTSMLNCVDYFDFLGLLDFPKSTGTKTTYAPPLP